jgi:photosystem II stability/assembly factor-like uncharacterized protein
MKQIKLIMLVLVAITIFSCYSSEPDCGNIIWEPAGSLPYFAGSLSITVASDGNIWVILPRVPEELYLSTNNGDTWNKKSNIPFIANSININPTNGHFFLGTVFGGLYRSTDNGENWKNILDSVAITDILFTISGEIYVGTHKYNYNTEPPYERETGFYYSNDNGNTWTNKIGALPNSSYIWQLALGKDGTLYAGLDNHGAYRSTDRGDSWLPSSNYNDVTIRGLTVCNNGSILAISHNVGILKSTDKGLNWNKVNNGFDNTGNVYKIISNPVTKDIFVINEFYSLTPPTFMNYDYEAYRSDNLGERWMNFDIPEGPINNLNVFAINPKTGQMFMGTDRGVYRTKNYPY